MIRKTTLKLSFLWLFLFLCALTYAQDRVYTTAISSENEVDLSNNAIDGNLTSNATIRANSGIALGIGAYSGHLELTYPSTLSANTTSYIKVETEDDILSSLLGGSLGDLLSDIIGVLLIGNQEFSIEALNINNVALQVSSDVVGAFASDEARVTIDKNGDYFMALTPNSSYDRLRLENRVGALIGLSETKSLDVFGAFYTNGAETCGAPSYTSYSGNGLTLDLLNLGGAGVTNPHLVLDGDQNTFSELGLGIIDIAANIEQTIYFDNPGDVNDNYYFQISINPSLLQLGVANSIEIIGQNGAGAPVYLGALTSLLDLDVLGLLQNGQTATVGFSTTAPIDRVTFRLSSLLGVSLDQRIRIHEVFRAPERPVITSTSQDLNICAGSSTNLVAEIQSINGAELRWYDAAQGGNLLATLNSGETFTTPILNNNITYYVASAEIGCVEESPRTEVEVNVVAIPTASDISVIGDENPVCSSNSIVLVPTSSVEGTFSWYFDANKTSEITDGLVAAGATYEIDSNGVLNITGLTEADGPYTYFVAVSDGLAGCENAPGDLQSVVVNVVDSNNNVSINSNTVLSLANLIDIFNGNNSVNVTGTVSGDVVAGEPISLAINGKLFDGAVEADSSFSIAVDAIDLVMDVDNTIEAFVQGILCTVSDEIPVSLPDLPIDNILQVFCASDLAVIADLDVDLNDVVFFDSLIGGAQLDVATGLENGAVYFAGILNIPTSVLARVQITVQIIDVPTPTTDSTDQVFCQSDSPVVGDIQTDQANVIFYDSASGGNVIDPSTPMEDGRRYYVVVVENGCESSERLRIMVDLIDDGTSPIILTGESEEVCQNRLYTYATNSNKQEYDWEITGGTIIEGGTSIDDFAIVSWTELGSNQISVSYTDQSSCSPSKIQSLEVDVISCGMVLGAEFCLKVFNEFSPNNDGFNDFFTVQCIENYSNTLEIYNRNGNLVYKAVDYRNTWNGLANVKGVLNNGDHLPSGTYYYSIAIPELERNLVGWLQLAR